MVPRPAAADLLFSTIAGLVLPFALEQRVRVVFRARADDILRVVADDLDDRGSISLSELKKRRAKDASYGPQIEPSAHCGEERVCSCFLRLSPFESLSLSLSHRLSTHGTGWLRYCAAPFSWFGVECGEEPRPRDRGESCRKKEHVSLASWRR